MTAKRTLTDNAHLASKLALRRHFLDKYHAGQKFRVFDACCGDQHIWGALRAEYPCAYFGVDRVKTRLRVDSARLCQDPKYAAFDVIDVDTYGSPWAHFFNLLPNVRKPVTIFLTYGRGGDIISRMPNVLRRAIGLDQLQQIPVILMSRVNAALGAEFAVGQASAFGLKLQEVKESFPQTNARYIGVRLLPS